MEITSIEPFLEYFGKIRERTLKVARCIPPERIDWTYAAGKFTLGDLLRHLGSIERQMFAENAQHHPSRYAGHGSDLAEGYDAVFAYLDRMHDESMAIFAKLTPEDLQSRCMTPGGASIPVWKWLRSMIEHEIHHRGQIYMYLAMLGIEGPPLYGLTSEEVRAKSLS
jgi:uncharacterized damage-inducible protein DinB